jgi:hypothetical protein
VLLEGLTAGPGVASCCCACATEPRADVLPPPEAADPVPFGPLVCWACSVAAPSTVIAVSVSTIAFCDARLFKKAISLMLNRLEILPL